MLVNQDFSVMGTALNAKYSAALQTADKLYYIPQLSAWSEEQEGKLWRVKGELHQQGQEPQIIDKNQPQSQQINGFFYTIEKASFEPAK